MKATFNWLLTAMALLLGTPGIFAQGTEFTYQGRILDNGTNFTGTGQFQFALVTSTNANHTAMATANAPSGGFITGYNLTTGGNGYVTAPAVTIFGGGGSGATATADLSGGIVTSLTANNAGSGYTSAPTVTIAPPPANIAYTTYWSNDGSSINGSEPSASIIIGVTSGLFTVVLGDSTIANMAAINSSLFSTPNLQLRIWFNDGIHDFAALSPAQNLTPTPYAIIANSVINGPIIQQNADGAPNVMDGSPMNFVSAGTVGATIAGGGAANYFGFSLTNGIARDFSVIGGGAANIIQSGGGAVIGGGIYNIVAGLESTVVGGRSNQIIGVGSFIGGGGTDGNNLIGNTINGNASTISGGLANWITGSYGTIPGGDHNAVSAVYSFAAGHRAKAYSPGMSVWADSQDGDFNPNNYGFYNNSFNVRVNGGILFTTGAGGANQTITWIAGQGSWGFSSDRNLKDRFESVNAQSVLDKVSKLPLSEWSYKGYGQRHIGPMAQDFHTLFPLNDNDKTLNDVDLHGVALAAIQGLNQKLEEQAAQLKEKDEAIHELSKSMAELKEIVSRISQEDHATFNQSMTNTNYKERKMQQ
jgi:hypothetical protein